LSEIILTGRSKLITKLPASMLSIVSTCALFNKRALSEVGTFALTGEAGVEMLKVLGGGFAGASLLKCNFELADSAISLGKLAL
jgi:hypothetical protein